MRAYRFKALFAKTFVGTNLFVNKRLTKNIERWESHYFLLFKIGDARR